MFHLSNFIILSSDWCIFDTNDLERTNLFREIFGAVQNFASIFNELMNSSHSVRLNVYYLTPYCSLHTFFNVVTLGLFSPYHCAIDIDGVEYAFYGHPFSFSGVMLNQTNFTSMILAFTRIYGQTTLSKSEIEEKAHHLSFRGNRYHLFDFNCNTFADRFLFALTKHHLPNWITRSERCLQRIRCAHQLFRTNEEINFKIVHALYLKSAGDQTAVFDLLELNQTSNLSTIYEVILQDHISCGKLPNFSRLRQISDPKINDFLTLIHQRFLRTFPDRSSLTLNKIFDDLSTLERQYRRFEHRAKVVSR